MNDPAAVWLPTDMQLSTTELVVGLLSKQRPPIGPHPGLRQPELLPDKLNLRQALDVVTYRHIKSEEPHSTTTRDPSQRSIDNCVYDARVSVN